MSYTYVKDKIGCRHSEYENYYSHKLGECIKSYQFASWDEDSKTKYEDL